MDGLRSTLLLYGLVVLLHSATCDEAAYKCSELPDLENGEKIYVDDENWPEEVCRVHFRCNPGYQLNGSANMYCFYGDWSGQMPTCVARPCPQLENPDNGYFTFVGPVPEYLTFSIAELRCDKGYQPDHQTENVLICNADGTWSDDAPQCMKQDCGQDALNMMDDSGSQKETTTEVQTTAPLQFSTQGNQQQDTETTSEILTTAPQEITTQDNQQQETDGGELCRMTEAGIPCPTECFHISWWINEYYCGLDEGTVRCLDEEVDCSLSSKTMIEDYDSDATENEGNNAITEQSNQTAKTETIDYTTAAETIDYITSTEQPDYSTVIGNMDFTTDSGNMDVTTDTGNIIFAFRAGNIDSASENINYTAITERPDYITFTDDVNYTTVAETLDFTTEDENVDYPNTTEQPDYTTAEDTDSNTTTEQPNYTTAPEDVDLNTTTEQPDYTTAAENADLNTTTEQPDYTTAAENADLNTTTEQPDFTTAAEDADSNTASEQPEDTTAAEDTDLNTTTEQPDYTTAAEDVDLNTTTEQPDHTTSAEDADLNTTEQPDYTATSKYLDSTSAAEMVDYTTTEEPAYPTPNWRSTIADISVEASEDAPIAEEALYTLRKGKLDKTMKGFYHYILPHADETVTKNDIFESGNKVFFSHGDEDIQATYDSSYKYENFEFSSDTSGHPFHSVMWIDNQNGTQQDDFTIKIESKFNIGPGKVTHKQGGFRGRSSYRGNAYALTFALFQVSKDADDDAPSVAELYYVISSNDKWESTFDGDMNIEFGKDETYNTNSVSISKDTKNTFFGYTLLAKGNGEIKSKDLRLFLRQLVRTYSKVNIDVEDAAEDGKKNKRDAEAPKNERWQWW